MNEKKDWLYLKVKVMEMPLLYHITSLGECQTVMVVMTLTLTRSVVMVAMMIILL
jgi:hypothetical protein